jgi:hypothetical protein
MVREFIRHDRVRIGEGNIVEFVQVTTELSMAMNGIGK